MTPAIALTQYRFWSKVVPSSSDCWLWNASLNPDGYGNVFIDGVCRKAHRVAYEWMVGPIPVGLELDHLCRMRACVNPYHLDPVTHRINILRGDAIKNSVAKRLSITHCPRNHEYTAENTRRQGRKRQCKECHRILANLRYAARKVGVS